MATTLPANSFWQKITPARLFWIMAGLHLALWTLIPSLTSPNAPLDVIEGYAWGREWLIGTYKHPPMQAWWLEILALLTGRAPWAHFLASQIAVAVAFWAVWRTGLRLTGEVTALLGVLLLEGIAYYNFTSPEFNPNVLQLPFWALACWSFHRAVKENRWFDWALLGLWAAGGMYTKYSMAVLLVVLGGVLIARPEARRRLGGAGPYLALAVMALLFAPHLNWLAAHDFQPFHYAESRTSQAVHALQRFTQPLGFLLAQMLSLLAMLLLFLAGSCGRWKWAGNLPVGAASFDRVFLHAVTFGPLIVILALSALLGFRPRDMWGSCLWNFIGLWLAVFIAKRAGRDDLRRYVIGWCLVLVLGLSAVAGSNLLYPYAKGKSLRVHFPGQALSDAVTQAWQTRFPETPLAYIAGDTWLAGNAAYYAQAFSTTARPHVMITSAPGGPAFPQDWQRRGGIVLWAENQRAENSASGDIPSYLAKLFPGAEIQQSLTLFWQTGAHLSPVIIGWAIAPPRPE